MKSKKIFWGCLSSQ